RLGADAAIEPTTEAILEANGGAKVDVVFEMAGGRIFDECLAALAPFGRLVTYGIASREPSTLQSGALMRRSQAVVGFWLMHCLGRREMMEEPLADLFERAARGELSAVVGGTFPLSEVRAVHESLQARRTSGKLLLDPSS
ncbi:MAG TPA: zinc-binding dehydrogenase, partial [Thermoleophilaceae bacterium]|nr:zinc-binding dehydrogenase [Thermoleophilaceae bacterium]